MASIVRLFVDEPLHRDGICSLAPEQAHYLINVMRLGEGEEIHLFNGRDGEWRAEISRAHKKHCEVSVRSLLREQQSEPDVWLVFAPIKKNRLDFLIEKATELGVSALYPVITRRTNSGKVRTDRLRAQVIEAAEQCERLHIPDVADAVALDRLIQDWSEERTLFVLNEQGGAMPILQALKRQKASKPAAFLVGPEGGFEPSELDLLEKLPFVESISAGPRILRAETAALSALSCWQSVCGDWQEPLRNRIEHNEGE